VPTAPEPGANSGAGNGEAVQGELPLTPVAPVPAGGAPLTLQLSELCALAGEQNGWGPIERDQSNGEQASGDGGPLTLGSTLYGKGLGTHAPSAVGFALGGACSSFSARVGVDAEMKRAGSVRFQVRGDGQLLAETQVLTAADGERALEVELAGVQQLELLAVAGDDSGSDHADWANAQITCTSSLPACPVARATAPSYDGYELAWQDEFEVDGAPSPANWSFETGFVRNEEAQWYQADNASVSSGFLIIEGRRERLPNPNYRAGSSDWKTSRQFAEYTSASLHSRSKQSFRFGRLELRARFPAYTGLWPAWWMLGNDGEWPSNGEIDILEFYGGSLHANFVVGTNTRYEGNWDAVATPLTALGDADWDARFHLYRMDWDDQRIVLSVDGKELNALNVADLRNPDGRSPFVNPAYTLLNLAIGGMAGGNPANVPFPARYEVDFVRVYAAQ
jgi:beta-glucanase (GH16 family)